MPLPGDSTSEVTATALEYLQEAEGLDLGHLAAMDAWPVTLPLTGVSLWQVHIIDRSSHESHIVCVNTLGEVVDGHALSREEEAARGALYGRLEPALYDALQERSDGEMVSVGIWLSDIDHQQIHREVLDRHPGLTMNGWAGLGGEALFDAIYQEMVQARAVAYAERASVLRNEIAGRGSPSTYASASAPLVFADLPRRTCSPSPSGRTWRRSTSPRSTSRS